MQAVTDTGNEFVQSGCLADGCNDEDTILLGPNGCVTVESIGSSRCGSANSAPCRRGRSVSQGRSRFVRALGSRGIHTVARSGFCRTASSDSIVPRTTLFVNTAPSEICRPHTVESTSVALSDSASKLRGQIEINHSPGELTEIVDLQAFRRTWPSKQTVGQKHKDSNVLSASNGKPTTTVAESHDLHFCGICPRNPSDDPSLSTFPKPAFLLEEVRSLHKLIGSTQTTSWPQREEHWPSALEDVKLPVLSSLVTPSAFSLQPHHQFPHLTVRAVSNLEVQLAQHMVFEPKMFFEQKTKPFEKQTQNLKTSVEDLEVATLRIIVRRNPSNRNKTDTQLLHAYLTQRPFFQDMQEETLAELTNSMEIRRYEPGQTLWKASDVVGGIHVLLRGCVSFPRPLTAIDEKLDYGDGRRFAVRGQVLGFMELMKSREKALPGQEVEEMYGLPRHSNEAVCTHLVETIFVSANTLFEVLDKQHLQEKLALLKELFPPTIGKTDTDLLQPSKIFKLGRRQTLHKIFELTVVPRFHVFHNQGERNSLEKAVIAIIVDGEVQLRAKGVVVNTLRRGGVIGEESLRGESYHYTAACTSQTVRVLWLTGFDYVAQFCGGRFPRNQTGIRRIIDEAFTPNINSQVDMQLLPTNAKIAGPKKAVTIADSSSSYSSDQDSDNDNSSGQSEIDSHEDQLHVRQMMEVSKTRVKRRVDREALLEQNWKTLKPKRAPARIAPGTLRENIRSTNQGPTNIALRGAASSTGRTLQTKRPQLRTKKIIRIGFDGVSTTETLRAPCGNILVSQRLAPRSEVDVEGAVPASPVRSQRLPPVQAPVPNWSDKFSFSVSSTNVASQEMPREPHLGKTRGRSWSSRTQRVRRVVP
eukprot:TRINITY_DN40878_c0_g1_i1.p1 TRINITY_DN40878_c0_g1~~TRINITY_DN40878_c0_g1_i1.p1  ORF type:complete len:869 (+),score=100.71 TRINITY_DN40878_c0_g1_i1:122-2728(+)